MNPCWCECLARSPLPFQALAPPAAAPHPLPLPRGTLLLPYRGSLPDMNKMLDKEDFTMMKRAIFATQVWSVSWHLTSNPHSS